MSEIYQAIIAAAQLVRRGWCRGSLARDGKGRVTDVHSKDAVKFCPAGAFQKVCAGREELCMNVSKVVREHLGMRPHEWNDGFVKNGRDCAARLEEIAETLACSRGISEEVNCEGR